MTAIKLPVFTRDSLPTDGWAEFRKVPPTWMVKIDGPFRVETREGILDCPDGYLAVDSGGWPYPIATEEQIRIYTLADPPLNSQPVPEELVTLLKEIERSFRERYEFYFNSTPAGMFRLLEQVGPVLSRLDAASGGKT